MKGRYMERRYHGHVGASVLGWALIAIGVVALAPQLGGVLFGGLVGVFAIVVPLLAIALAVVIVLCSGSVVRRIRTRGSAASVRPAGTRRQHRRQRAKARRRRFCANATPPVSFRRVSSRGC